MPQECVRATDIKLVHTNSQCGGKKRSYSYIKQERQQPSPYKVASISSSASDSSNTHSGGTTMANNKNSSSSGGEGDYQLVQHEVAMMA